MNRRRLLVVFAAVFVAIFAIPRTAPAQNDQPMFAQVGLAAAVVEAYWTEERMRNATPMPVPEVAAGQAGGLLGGGGNADPTGPMVMANAGGPGDIPSEEVRPGAASLGTVEPLFGTAPFSYTRYRLFPDTIAQYKLFPYRLTGKLFFKIPGDPRDWVCSGSVVNSSNLSVVWTAGHCVYSPGIGYHTNFAFSPARRLATNPYGLWTAKTAITLNGWANGLFEYDHGVLVMNQNGAKKKIGQVVGFLGFVANAARGQHWHLHGYPLGARNLAQTPPGAQFDGVHHEICAASWATNDLPTGGAFDPPTIGVGCDKTGGTSGGPWVIDFSGVGGATNLLNGNNSYRYTGPNPPENLKLFSPYFTTGAINLRNAAQAIPVP